MVHQHFVLVGNLTITENIILGHEPRKGILLDRGKARQKVEALIRRYHFGLNPESRIENLSVGEKQRVEILKALYNESSIILLDEPTAVLTPQEVQELFAMLRQLKKDGRTIIIITHKLKETLAIADNITFAVPAVAGGVVPYKAAAAAASGGGADIGTTIETSNDALASVVTQVVTNATAAIVTAIQNYSGTTVNFDKTAIAESTIREINRRTRATGKSPLE